MLPISEPPVKVFSPPGLRQLSSGLLLKVQVSPKDAELIAELLMQANLRGVDSHGVARMAIYKEYGVLWCGDLPLKTGSGNNFFGDHGFLF